MCVCDFFRQIGHHPESWLLILSPFAPEKSLCFVRQLSVRRRIHNPSEFLVGQSKSWLRLIFSEFWRSLRYCCVAILRKPTLGKGSKDGGLSFVVEGHPSAGLTLTLRRISEGQEIRKVCERTYLPEKESSTCLPLCVYTLCGLSHWFFKDYICLLFYHVVVIIYVDRMSSSVGVVPEAIADFIVAGDYW